MVGAEIDFAVERELRRGNAEAIDAGEMRNTLLPRESWTSNVRAREEAAWRPARFKARARTWMVWLGFGEILHLDCAGDCSGKTQLDVGGAVAIQAPATQEEG